MLAVSQKKFCAGGKETEDFTKYLWKVPVNVQTPHGVEKFLLSEREQEFRLKGVSDKDWIKVAGVGVQEVFSVVYRKYLVWYTGNVVWCTGSI